MYEDTLIVLGSEVWDEGLVGFVGLIRHVIGFCDKFLLNQQLYEGVRGAIYGYGWL